MAEFINVGGSSGGGGGGTIGGSGTAGQVAIFTAASTIGDAGVGAMTANDNANNVLTVTQQGTSNTNAALFFNSSVSNIGVVVAFQSANTTAVDVPAAALTRLDKTAGHQVSTRAFLWNASSVPVSYSDIGTEIIANTAGAHTGDIAFSVASAGALTERLRIKNTGELLFVGAGAVVTIPERAAAPAAVSNFGKVYVKDVAGVSQLFYLADDSTESQITPAASAIWSLSSGIITPTTLTNKVIVGHYAGTADSVWSFAGNELVLRGEQTTGGDALLALEYATDLAASQPEFTAYRSRGTMAAPTSVQNGDSLVRYAAVGFDGSAWRFCATMDLVAESTFSDGTPYKAAVVFKTGGATPSEKIRINNSGYLLASNGPGGNAGGLSVVNEVLSVGHGITDSNIRQILFYNAADAPKSIINVNVDTGQYQSFIPDAAQSEVARFSHAEVLFSRSVQTTNHVRIPNNFALLSKTSNTTEVVLIEIDNTSTLYVADGNVPHAWVYCPDVKIGINGSSVIGFYGASGSARAGTIPDAAGGAIVDTEARAAINSLLVACRGMNIITP